MAEEKQTLTPIEAINEFYRLKDKYETSYYEKYVTPIINNSKPKKQKRVAFSRLPKNECINCKRNVGTIFTVKYNKSEYIRQFIAKCGDFQDPCPLDIQINYSARQTFSRDINFELNNVDKLKLEIIKEKNNALFFNKDVIKLFEEITTELKDIMELTGQTIEKNILRNDNPEKHALIKKTIDEFGKGFIMPFKQMVQEFNETNNELILNQAVNFYINEMIPKLKDIQELKYEVNFVEYDQKDQLFKLIQMPTSLESNENTFKEDDKVVKFIKGVKKDKKSKSKTKKVMEVVTKKTRKIRPTGDLLIEEDVEEEVVEENPELPPNFNNNPTNNNPTYEQPQVVEENQELETNFNDNTTNNNPTNDLPQDVV